MERTPPTIDMRPDGRFGMPPRRPVVPLSAKMLIAAVAVAAVGVSVLVAAFALWVFAMLLPVVIVSAVAAWGLYRYKRWQLFRSQRGGAPSPVQPGRFR